MGASYAEMEIATMHNLAKNVQVLLPRTALATVFDDCDRFYQDETGGRLIGTFAERRGNLTIQVAGIIESGPQARRTSVSFYQDGAYQEGVFRRLEATHPEIEHLGNWHTHHVNGYPTLSDGDVATYRRTVNHPNHNTSFFYAILVTAKQERARDPLARYSVKHYVLRRGDDAVYEIPEKQVKLVRTELVWPMRQHLHTADITAPPRDRFGARPERAHDRDILAEFYDGLKPFASKSLGVYWRGPIGLVDGSHVQILLHENMSAGTPQYSIVLKEPPRALIAAAAKLEQCAFRSARAALVTAERACNRALYEHDRGAGTAKG
jgi:hypothetical protein